MTEEEKKIAEAAKAETEAKAKEDKEKADAEFEASLDGLSDEEKASKQAEKDATEKTSDNQIDYEAEAKKEREAREKAEKALADRRYKNDSHKRKEEDDKEGDEDDNKPLTRGEMRAMLAENSQATTKQLTIAKAEEIAGDLATTPGEKNLILEIYKNRSFPPHLSLQEQMEESYAIANRKKLVGERNEALRALKNKGAVNKNGAPAHRDAPEGPEPQTTSSEKEAFTASGFKWNGTSRQWEKQVNGGVVIRDSKTGKTQFLSRKK